MWGLIGPGDRKSIQPMAAREGGVGYDQLHPFVAAGTQATAPVESAPLKEADRLLGGEDAFLIIDDAALPKDGKNSEGVAPQHATRWVRTPTARPWPPPQSLNARSQ